MSHYQFMVVVSIKDDAVYVDIIILLVLIGEDEEGACCFYIFFVEH